ncbi:MAG: chitobiase/beta-hexosaminidase C-terminal domain-containing protein [Candidatus Syntrophosphaera sp.]|nr:chitobiase/beta-hexosaminidase C-terminal domain-containing protein [Candidatus Cloacimonadota bacterium]MDX9950339.1 chitobiase/beta-hexosaminidase C-terminal domain-containing protein [Candidatus Syntrophosphaera sp.]
MFKKLLIAFSLIFALGIVWAQGLETFENHTLSGSNYFNGNYVGDNNITWNYVHCSGEQSYPIDDKGLLLRSLGKESEVYSNSIPGGIGDFSVQMRKAFTGAGDRQVALYVNGDWVADSQTFGGTSGADDTIHTFTVNNVNIPGDVVISIKSTTGTGSNYRQLVIDNLSWTGYSGGTPTPIISVSGSLTAFSTEVGSPSLAQTYSLSGSNLTANISVAAPAGFEISSDGSSYSGSLSLSSSYNGSVYVRLIGTTAGEYSGNITHSSTGASDVNMAVSGTVYEPEEPEEPVLLMEENFVYEVGTTLVENGWTAHSGAGNNSPTVVDINLIYPNYPPSSGYAGQTLGNGEDVNRAFVPQTSGEVYTSFLINVTDASTGNGDYVYHFMAANSTSDFKAKFFVSKDANDNIRFGLTKQSNAGANVVYTDYDYAPGTTYLVVLKYEFVPGTTNDIVTGWINPVIGPNEPTPTLSPITNEADIGSTGIGAIAIRQTANTPYAIFDGIRVTNDWALLWSSETPEPRFIHVSGEPDPLANIAGTPSEEISYYNLSGENLVGPITITAPTGFEVSYDAEQGWGNPIQVPATFDDKIYVRLVSSELGEHAGSIVHTSSGAAPVSIRVEGETFPPDVTFNIVASLDAFEQTIGSPSAVQSYSLSATGALANIEVEVESPFELSETGTGNWTDELTLPNNFNGTIYVRMNASVVGQYSKNIVHETPGASTENLPVSGTAIPPSGDQYATDLFFSEYIEGSSNNKAIEIFNGTGAAVDLANYKVKLFANGGTTPTSTETFESGTILNHGSVYVLVHSQAGAALQALKTINSATTNFNGNDALALLKIVGEDEVYVDIFGTIGEDPGTAWTADGGYSTLDKTLVRKAAVTGGVTENPDAGFPTLAAEWDVYPIDTITNLGWHIFAPGEEVVELPEISPDSGTYYAPFNVSITCATDGADIYYTTDGSDPIQNGALYLAPFNVSQNTTVKAYATAEGMISSTVATKVYNFPIDVQDIAELRTKPVNTSDIYRLVGEAVLTYQNANRNTKYIQDATAAIVIDDLAGIITSTYNLYDGITGISGSLTLYSGLLQFVPKADPGAATSSNNVVVPEVRTLASLTSADQAKLIKVMNVNVDDTVFQSYPATAQNINVTDPSGSAVMRTFVNTDYANTAVHTVPVNITCLAGQFNATMQISPRFLSDFEAYTEGLEAPVVTITKDGNNIKLNWNPVAGATAYDIYGSNDPYSGYILLEGNWTGTEWTQAPADMKFYYVKAKN